MTEKQNAYLKDTFGLEGKVALITGSREGLGETIALAYASAGAKVVVTSRSGKGMDELVKKIKDLGSEAYPIALELQDLDSCKAAVEDTVKHFGKIDILVNNAAYAYRGNSLTYPPDQMDKSLAINYKAPFYMSQYAAQHMVKQGGGRIISISTAHAHLAMEQRVAYAGLKAGLEFATKILAMEWAKYNITCNVVAPTTMLTPTRAHIFPTEADRRERMSIIPMCQPFDRMQIPEDVAPAVVFLASDAGRFITGETVVVDGGFSIGYADKVNVDGKGEKA